MKSGDLKILSVVKKHTIFYGNFIMHCSSGMLNFTIHLMSQTSVHSRVHIFIIIREIRSP